MSSPKKGDQLQKYRGISLLCTAYRIVATVLYNTLQPYGEKIIEEYQEAFGP